MPADWNAALLKKASSPLRAASTWALMAALTAAGRPETTGLLIVAVQPPFSVPEYCSVAPVTTGVGPWLAGTVALFFGPVEPDAEADCSEAFLG